jgi:hypothetical protein
VSLGHETLIFILGWGQYEFHKKHARTHFTDLLFLHPVGFAGHIVHSSVFGARNVDAVFFMLWWDRYGIDKKHVIADTSCQTCVFCIWWDIWVTCIPELSRHETSTDYFSCLGGPIVFSIKNHVGTHYATVVFCIRWDLWVT